MMRRPSVRTDRRSNPLRRRYRRPRAERRSERRSRLLPAIEPLESRYLLAFTTELLGDINQLGISAFPDTLVEFNGAAIFVADDGQTGSELWRSDGTEAGTVQIADLVPGPRGSLPADLTIVDGELFFTALDADDEFDLWKTDGTTAGTVKVFDADTAGVYYMSDLTASGGKLFFNAYQMATGYEVWVSDGTSAGTQLVQDINPDQTIIDRPQELTDVNGTLFFSSYQSGYDNRELYRTDESGGMLGAVLVADIDGDPLTSSNPSNLTNFNGTLFFAADTATGGVELYKSDGTAAGTQLVADLNPGAASSYPDDLTVFNGQLFFSANDGTGRQLYRTDGTTTTLVANTTGNGGPSNPSNFAVVGNELFFASEGGIVPGPVVAVAPTLTSSNSFNSAAGVVISFNRPDQGQIRTASSTGINVTAPSGGNGAIGAAGVGLSSLGVNDLYLRDIDPGDLQTDAWDWEISDAGGLSAIDFSGFVSGNEFNRPQTDPSPEGVRFELFINGGAAPVETLIVDGDALDDWNGSRDSGNLSLSHPGGPTITSATVRMTLLGSGVDGSNEALLVGASLTAIGETSGTAGRELFKTDGTTTSLVKNILFVGSSNPAQLTEAGGQLFFTANDPINTGRELWVSDGTEAGTQLVRDIRGGTDAYGAPLSGFPENLTEINNQLFFSVLDDLDDRELWISDGTAAGTELIKNINEGSRDANIQQVTQVGDKVYFVANDGINGEAVWVADPVAGTVTLAADLTPSATDKISGLAAFNGGVAFFHDSLGVHFTNGTTTTLLTSLEPVDLDANGKLFTEYNGELYLVLNDLTVGEELFSIAPGGSPSLVVDLYNGSLGSDPRELVVFDNRLLFVAEERNSMNGSGFGRELYSTDGTGTSLVTDANAQIDPNVGTVTLGSFPEQLTVSGNRLYFTADDGSNGRELWAATNSTTAALVENINPGSASSNPFNLTDVGGELYFAANDGTNGVEPFRSDGTATGTALVANVNGAASSSNPAGFVKAGPLVYFAATETTTGRELYVTDGTPSGTLLVEDLQIGSDNSDPIPLADAGGDRVLVSAIGSGLFDRELWIAGGTITGVALAADINPGVYFGSDPRDLVEIGGERILVADDGFSGQEIFRLIETAPVVESVLIEGGAQQRSSIDSVQLIFNSQVDISGDPFSFLNTSTSQVVDYSANVSTQNGKTVVDFSFLPGPSVNANGLLLDGEYTLTVNASLINSLGLLLDGNGDGTSGDDYVFGALAADNFFRKFGDNDGNDFVDLIDFAAFRATFALSAGTAGYNDAMDANGDDVVDLLDFAEFRANFGS